MSGPWATTLISRLGDPKGDKTAYAPPLAQFAFREAKVLAGNILAHLDGRPMTAFEYRSLGTMAALGGRTGVADILGVRITGFLAWAAWRLFYLSLLPGLSTRVRVAVDWLLDLFISRSIVEIRPSHPAGGYIRLFSDDIAIEPGVEPAGVYIVVSGSFELTVPAPAADDAASHSRRLGPGDWFGLSLEGQPPAAPERVRACEDSTAYFIDKSDLKRLAIGRRSGRKTAAEAREHASGGRMTSEGDSETMRLRQADAGEKAWRRWGPYLSERQWGTVREDYSANGDAWAYLPHEAARSHVYRWGEDGLGGFCDDQQNLCLCIALWNGKDPILKERLFGLTNAEGNHGEDVKEIYYYLDATPTYSYARMLYKYPQAAYPYEWLVEENRRRGKQQLEFELIDTGLFDADKYFDVEIEYAKADVDDVLLRITATNRGPSAARLHVLPQVWFRNTWNWFRDAKRPSLKAVGNSVISVEHELLGNFTVHYENPQDLLFCDNETNAPKLFGMADVRGYFKDGFHEYLVHGNAGAVNPAKAGTKATGVYAPIVPAGGNVVVRVRLSTGRHNPKPFADFDEIFRRRTAEADAYYAELQSNIPDEDVRRVQRQALAGMLWSKQYYYYDVREWLDGDPGQPTPPQSRRSGRNNAWFHLYAADVIAVPDKWEYPWFAAWDWAFHLVTLALVDPQFAKDQLILLCQVWYMHPNGQMPAYEWNFSDVNPPVHAWAALRIYEMDKRQNGGNGDRGFLERVFVKLLLNFTWWVNRKDPAGRNVFQGGFLGLDNIGIFDRSAPLPVDGTLTQSDGTSWMAMFCLNMLRIALELAQEDNVYEDIAIKFFEHFLLIGGAMTNLGGQGCGLWDDRGQLLLRLADPPVGRKDPAQAPFARRADPAVRGRGARRGSAEGHAGVYSAHEVVPPAPSATREAGNPRGRARRRKPSAHRDRPRLPHEARFRTRAGRKRVSLALWRALGFAGLPGSPLCLRIRRVPFRSEVRAGGVR